MSPDKPMVSIDGEWLLERIQDLEIIINEIRSEASRGAFVERLPTARDIIKAPPTPTGIDLDAINWLVKGSEPFKEGDTWGWAFSRDQEGNILDSTRELVKVIERDGKAIIDGYVIKLGGRKGGLLSRQKVKR